MIFSSIAAYIAVTQYLSMAEPLSIEQQHRDLPSRTEQSLYNTLEKRRLDSLGFVQLGSNIYGAPSSNSTTEVEFGTAVALSKNDGSYLAIGAPYHDSRQGMSDSAGGVFLYEYVEKKWSLRWSISGDQNEQLGDRLSISEDGSRVAVRRYNGNPNPAQIYDISPDGTSMLLGTVAGAASGNTVTLSADGRRLALSCESYNGFTGRVQFFEYKNDDWIDIGTLVGVDGQDRFGWMTSFTPTGDVVAISAPTYDGDLSNRGLVRVFAYAGRKSWIQLGDDIVGSNADDRFGFSMDYSDDGSTLVIGSPTSNGGGRNRGKVSVYKFLQGSWQLLGDEIEGVVDNDRFGRSVSTNKDGTRIMASSYIHNQQRGHVRIFDWTDAGWVQAGSDIDGRFQDRLGYGVSGISMTRDGVRVAVGSVLAKNSDGKSTGSVRVLEEIIPHPGFCGFPRDILPSGDPYEEPDMLCNSIVEKEGDCAAASFFSAYRCRWKDGRCTSDADLTDEDFTCPPISNQQACDAKTWAGSRSCVWYELTPAPSQAPSMAPSASPTFCGFPRDILGDEDPFIEPREYCDNFASNEGECVTSNFVSAYQCSWEGGRCTSSADLTGEDSTCPTIFDQQECDRTTWTGSRICVWYELTPAPTVQPSMSPSAAPEFCGFPSDIIGDSDPFLEPREYCNNIARTQSACESSSFVSAYECSWEAGRCSSGADVTSEDSTCPAITDQQICDGTTWTGSRACVWYEPMIPSSKPTDAPTMEPSHSQHPSESHAPSTTQSQEPSISSSPSREPSRSQQPSDSQQPSISPTQMPSKSWKPSLTPSASISPSHMPSNSPSTSQKPSGSFQPSFSPTSVPTGSARPSNYDPTQAPSVAPSLTPSAIPTSFPSSPPSETPTTRPTQRPTMRPTRKPTPIPTPEPTERPTPTPSMGSTKRPTPRPSPGPSPSPSQNPSGSPTFEPTLSPTQSPTSRPTSEPSPGPSPGPTGRPTPGPTGSLSDNPTRQPTLHPTARPTRAPIAEPTVPPTRQPTRRPTGAPTPFPTLAPTTRPPTPPPSTQISPGERLVTACQCDTAGRECQTEPINEGSSVYLCLRTEMDSVEFVDVRDLRFMQDGNIKDEPIIGFSRSGRTFVSVEGRFVTIRSELDESFYTTIFDDEVPSDVHAEGVAILAFTDNRGRRQLRDITMRFLQGGNGNFEIDFPVAASQDVLGNINPPNDSGGDSGSQQNNAWTLTGLIVIIAVAVTGALILTAFKRVRSHRVAQAAAARQASAAAAAAATTAPAPVMFPATGQMMMLPGGQMMAAPPAAAAAPPPPPPPSRKGWFSRS